MVLTLLPSGALAVEIFVTSDEGVALIEEFEGYRDMPYADDRGNWYIGYGTACDPADYPDGITEEEADMLSVRTWRIRRRRSTPAAGLWHLRHPIPV